MSNRINCHKCEQEITQEDEATANWREFDGKYSHRLCPNTLHKCHICGNDIHENEIKTAVGYKHQGCKLNLKPSYDEPNPSSWIVK
jgi:hypothetical protein